MNVLSLFTGVGGFDIAIENNRHTIVAQSEVDKHCIKILNKHFPNIPNLGSVKDIDGRQYRGIDVICGGFPCQDVSVAGRRSGLAGEKSGLWFEFARIIEEAQPKTFLIENVPGLLSSNGGRDFGTILGKMDELGYGISWRILDGQHFGVPQRRRRVFIVGYFGDGERAREILFKPESGSRNSSKGKQAGQKTSAFTASSLGGCGPDDNSAQAHHIVAFEKAGTLASRTEGGGFPGSDDAFSGYVIPFRKSQRAHHSQDCETWERAEVANTLDTGNSTTTAHAIAFHITQDPINGNVSPAITSGNAKGCAVIGVHNRLGVRKLMPIECERLQGFPDGWTEGLADTNRYRCLGNAVCVPVVDWIVRRMDDVIH